jgi:NAD(P)-dependent dehydrogenase (short-subunit alcohol dehydrogenase family)
MLNVKYMELQGKRALVTGGAVRIGRAITEALLAEGAGVIEYDFGVRRLACALSTEACFGITRSELRF